MAVLRLDPTKAPDLSGTSRILARAGLTLERSFDAAQGLLSSYQDGQQERIDNEVFAETAGMDREQLDQFFANNGLKGRQLSQKGRERLGGQAAATADVNRTRGLSDALISETGRLDTVADRRTVEADRVIQARNAKLGMTGVEVDAARAARAGNVSVSTPGANALQAAVGGESRAPAHLIGNESGGNFQATNEAVGSGGVKGHDGRVQAGAARITDAKRAGVLPPNMTRQEFRDSPELQVAFENWHFGDIDNNIEKNGYEKYIGTKINGVTVTHAGMVDVQHLGGATGLKDFLESGGRADPKDENGTSLTDYLQMGGKAAVAEQVGPTGAAATLQAAATPSAGASPQDLLRAAQAANPNLTSEQILASDASLRTAASEGKAVRDAAIEKIRVEEVATNLANALENENITDEAALRNSVDENTAPGGTNVDKLATWKRVREATLDFASILSPEVDMPDGTMAATTAAMEIQDNVLAALPQTYTYDMAATFVGGPDAPRNGIVELLNLSTDPENPEVQFLFFGENGRDLNILDKLIDKIASDAKVTHAVAAAAMVKHFVRNPTGSNTADKRFQQEVTTQWLKDNMDPQSMKMYASERLSILAKRDDYKADAKELNEWMVIQEKQTRNGTDTSSIDAKIEKRTNTMLRGHTSKQSPQSRTSNTLVSAGPNRSELNQISERISMLHKMKLGSRAHIVIGRTLRKQVEDSTTLSAIEKRLLLADIKG